MKPVAPVTKYAKVKAPPGAGIRARSLYPGARPAAPLAGGEAGRSGGRVGVRRRGVAGLDRQAIGEREAEPVVDRAAVGEHRLLRERGEARSDLERALEVRVRPDDLGQQAEAERLGRPDQPPGEDEVERAAEPDDARQSLRAAVDQRDAEAALGEPERRASRSR